ncbi:unnamed protein product [Amoebophrya sp. A25]|nr:unnamed protein product [Amoebophrya sp. A25]|eukprot:GSA25T00026855001.1
MKPNGGGRPPVSLVYYHIPTDQDEAQFPNAFPLAKARGDIKLRDIREKFPLPGQYHFRFKLKWSDSQAVWMDVTNEDSAVPVYDDKIICKVLRISWTSNGPGGAVGNARAHSSGPQNNVGASVGRTGAPSSGVGNNTAQTSKPAKVANTDLLFGGDSPKGSKNTSSTDLLFDGFASAPPPPAKKDDFDLF